MSAKQLVDDFVELRDVIVGKTMSPKAALQRKILVLSLKTYKLERQYAAARRKHGDIDLAEPFSPEDRANIREADKVNREIGKYLSDLRKGIKSGVAAG